MALLRKFFGLPKLMIVAIVCVLLITLAGVGFSLTNDLNLNQCGLPPSTAVVAGYDALTYLQSGCDIINRVSPYVEGKWSSNTNFRFHPFWAWVFSWFPTSVWGWAKALIIIGLGIASLLLVPTTQRVLEFTFQDVKGSVSLSRLQNDVLLFGIVLIQIWYANLDPLMLLLSLVLLLAIWRKQAGLAGVLTAITISFKFHYWIWPLIFLVVTMQWRFLLKTALYTALAYGIMSLIFIVAVGPQYGITTLINYFVFLANSAKNILIDLPPAATWNEFNNSIPQTLIRYVGDVPWVWSVASGIVIALVVYFIGLVIWVWRKFAGKIPTLVGLLVSLQFHLVVMLASPQLETAMVVVFVVPLIRALRQITNVKGLWMLLVYSWGFIPMAIIYSFTGFDFFNWPYFFPLVLLTFIAMGWLLHRNIIALVAAKDQGDKALDAAIM